MLIRRIEIWCDWPGCSACVDEEDSTAREVQQVAEAEGWKLQNKLLGSGMALCPAHAASGEWDSIARSVAVEMLRLEAEAKLEETACG